MTYAAAASSPNKGMRSSTCLLSTACDDCGKNKGENINYLLHSQRLSHLFSADVSASEDDFLTYPEFGGALPNRCPPHNQVTGGCEFTLTDRRMQLREMTMNIIVVIHDRDISKADHPFQIINKKQKELCLFSPFVYYWIGSTRTAI
jgi:hypothetical protein